MKKAILLHSLILTKAFCFVLLRTLLQDWDILWQWSGMLEATQIKKNFTPTMLLHSRSKFSTSQQGLKFLFSYKINWQTCVYWRRDGPYKVCVCVCFWGLSCSKADHYLEMVAMSQKETLRWQCLRRRKSERGYL